MLYLSFYLYFVSIWFVLVLYHSFIFCILFLFLNLRKYMLKICLAIENNQIIKKCFQILRNGEHRTKQICVFKIFFFIFNEAS